VTSSPASPPPPVHPVQEATPDTTEPVLKSNDQAPKLAGLTNDAKRNEPDEPPASHKGERIEPPSRRRYKFLGIDADWLAMIAFILSGVNLIFYLFAFAEGSKIRLVGIDEIYVATDNTGSHSVPLIVVSDILLFNRAIDPHSDVVTGYELTLTFPDDTEVCIEASSDTSPIWLGRRRTERLAQVGVAEVDAGCNDCLAYQRLRLVRNRSARGMAIEPRSAAMQSVEFTFVASDACDAASAALIEAMTFEQLLQRMEPTADVHLRVKTFFDGARTLRCSLAVGGEELERTVRRGWTSNECVQPSRITPLQVLSGLAQA
jgi:hypothetical protein